MDAAQLLTEYLKEQYAQARQHENRQTAATTFLTAAAAAILSLAVKDGEIHQRQWWLGIVVALIGFANVRILSAHHLGNRFHTRLAGKVRRRLERMCDWDGEPTATDLRIEALEEMGLRGPDVTIGGRVHGRLRSIPVLLVVLGVSIAIGAAYFGKPS
jgi:ABC-type transport system involved in cytochrome bd biosynthesis fused ATPase/permease subunit